MITIHDINLHVLSLALSELSQYGVNTMGHLLLIILPECIQARYRPTYVNTYLEEHCISYKLFILPNHTDIDLLGPIK